MSDSDSFIKEVGEELRRDRMSRLWRRFAPAAGVVVVVAVAAAAVATWLEHRETEAAQAAGGALIRAADAGSAQAQATAFAALAEASEAGPALVARLSQASALAEAGDAAGAAAVMQAVASDGTVDPLHREVAGFKAALLRAPDMAPAERATAMTPFAAEGGPFRLLALEARAMAHLEAGEADRARADVDAALADPLLTPSLRDRLLRLGQLAGGGT